MRPVAVVLLLVLPLAGCMGAPSAPVETAQLEPILVTEENDLASLANGSFMMEAHQHDYWGGQERLTLIDTARDDATFWFGGAWAFPFYPDDGVVVPQGTARLEITVTWVDAERAHYSDPELAVKTAADDVPVVIGPVASGVTVTLPVELAQTDLPHQTISAWRFDWRLHPGIVPVEGSRGIWWQGNVSMKVDAVRGGEIPVYPPHPDLWDGRETLPLFSVTRGPALWFGSPDDWSCFSTCPVRLSPDNGTVVPFDSAMVRAVLEPHPDVLVQIGLLYHDGRTRAWTELAPTSTQGRAQLYEIPVPLGAADSPYATQSVWEFAVFVAAPERDGVMQGTYTLSAEALKGVAPSLDDSSTDRRIAS